MNRSARLPSPGNVAAEPEAVKSSAISSPLERDEPASSSCLRKTRRSLRRVIASKPAIGEVSNAIALSTETVSELNAC